MIKNVESCLVHINDEVAPTGYTKKVECIELANELDCSC
jgi:hypothetical protein